MALPHEIYYPLRDSTPCLRIACERFRPQTESYPGEHIPKIAELFRTSHEAGATGWEFDPEQCDLCFWKALSHEEYLELKIENFEHELKELKGQ